MTVEVRVERGPNGLRLIVGGVVVEPPKPRRRRRRAKPPPAPSLETHSPEDLCAWAAQLAEGAWQIPPPDPGTERL